MIRRFTSSSSSAAFVAAFSVLRCCSIIATNNDKNKALLNLNDQISQVLVQSTKSSTLVGRMISNEGSAHRPWEASCIEVEPATRCRSRSSNNVTDEDPAENSFIVLYYETHTQEGLAAFRSVAKRVAMKQLPGETVNRMSIGFALWRVPTKEFLLLNANPQLRE